MYNNHFYNLCEGLIADMKEMCNKLTDISNNCKKMYCKCIKVIDNGI